MAKKIQAKESSNNKANILDENDVQKLAKYDKIQNYLNARL